MKATDLWKPTDSHFIQSPYAAYGEIRKISDVFEANTGDFVIMGYHDCKRILQDPSFESGLRLKWIKKMTEQAAIRDQSFHHVKEAVSGMLVQLNPPNQQHIRADFAKSWPSTEELKKLSEEITVRVISELPKRLDAIDLLCRRIPLQVISQLLGLKWEETNNYAIDGINMVQILGPYLTYRDLTTISQSTQRLQSFLKDQIYSDTYIPTRITENIIKKYSGKEAINLLLFLFIAGYETTSSLLTLCLYHLLKNKDHIPKIEEFGTQPFIDEILRRHSPVQITGRTNTNSIEIGGLHVPANSALTLCIGAANVDPNQFENADEFVWNRSKREHLSFGYGMHFCLGNQLAEIEAQVLIEKLLPKLDKFEIVNEPVLRNMFTIKSYQSFDLSYQ